MGDKRAEMEFARTVPEAEQDAVLERISEAIWHGGVEGVSVIDSEKRNVTNIEATGTVMIGDEEVWFHIREGDSVGMEIVGWGESSPSEGILREPPEMVTVVPLGFHVSAAIVEGRAESFLGEWDAAISSPGSEVASLPGKAAYDSFFAPGTPASASHHKRANDLGYEISTEDHARRVRASLIAASLRAVPVLIEKEEPPARVLAEWDARAASPEAVAAFGKIVAAMASAVGPSRSPCPEGVAELAAINLQVARARDASRVRREMVRASLSVSPIDGFDPKDLPENPIAELFRRLDPALVSSTKVVPEREAERLLEALADRVARGGPGAQVPESYHEAAAAIGYVINHDVIEPEVEADNENDNAAPEM